VLIRSLSGVLLGFPSLWLLLITNRAGVDDRREELERSHGQSSRTHRFLLFVTTDYRQQRFVRLLRCCREVPFIGNWIGRRFPRLARWDRSIGCESMAVSA
jgi:hypothetical protein